MQSAFTLRVARTILGQKKIGGRYPKSLNKLLADDEFRMAVADAASKIANMKVQFVEAGSLRLRIVLEVQVGLVFKTKWNDFNLEEA